MQAANAGSDRPEDPAPSHSEGPTADLGQERLMLAVNRLRSLGEPEDQLLDDLAALIAVLSSLPGFRSARAGRCIDQPDVWLLLSEWESVGTYRRALSSHAVKVDGYPVFARIVDEPGAYEVLLSTG